MPENELTTTARLATELDYLKYACLPLGKTLVQIHQAAEHSEVPW